jgi:sarcosine oxidase subunit delta
MLRIECPWCGTRDETEFTYGGESHISRPPQDCSDEAWSSYLFFRSNTKGQHAERWCHSYGCGQWFNVLRDTVTHRIIAVYRMGEPRPPAEVDPAP